MNRLVVSREFDTVQFRDFLITISPEGHLKIGRIGVQISPTSNQILDVGHSPEDNREMFLLPLDTVSKEMKLETAKKEAENLSKEFAVFSGTNIYVPTIKELKLLYKKKDSLGLQFKDATYLSSTVNESGCVYTVDFSNGFSGIHGENVPQCVAFIMR